jgi:hypothetical protein
MKNKKTKFSALLLFGMGLSTGLAQQALTASGGDASGIGGSAAYSVAQIIYTTNTGSSGSVAQGVQQPYEITITTGLTEAGININLSAYPTPTIDGLTLKVENYDKNMLYQLFDITGKVLESNQVVANSTTIKMEHYANAIYFLKVTQNNKEIKIFKVIKNN